MLDIHSHRILTTTPNSHRKLTRNPKVTHKILTATPQILTAYELTDTLSVSKLFTDTNFERVFVVKKLLSLVLALIMTAGLLPALAADDLPPLPQDVSCIPLPQPVAENEESAAAARFYPHGCHNWATVFTAYRTMSFNAVEIYTFIVGGKYKLYIDIYPENAPVPPVSVSYIHQDGSGGWNEYYPSAAGGVNAYSYEGVTTVSESWERIILSQPINVTEGDKVAISILFDRSIISKALLAFTDEATMREAYHPGFYSDYVSACEMAPMAPYVGCLRPAAVKDEYGNDVEDPELPKPQDSPKKEEGCCIDYSHRDLTVSGQIDGADASGFLINLTKDTLAYPDTYIPAAFSVDGGNKWRAVKPNTFSRFARMLNKDLTLHLSEVTIDKKTKKPPSGTEIVKFAKIAKRPPALKLRVNYSLAADATGKTAGQWVVSEKGGKTAVKQDVQVGVADAAKKNKVLDEKGFGHFYEHCGICVKPLEGTRPGKYVYHIRTAPKQSGTTYTAGGKARRITARSELKETRIKPKTHKKTGVETIKLKKGDYIFAGMPNGLGANPQNISGTAVIANGNVRYSAERSVATVTNVNGEITVWRGATEKKPASKKQVIQR